MKLDFIKRGAATRLILIFAGWSTDARYYNDCVFDGWDTAVISDYRDLTMPAIPDQYSTVYIFAFSLGVFAASRARVKAAARVAICGSPFPVSDIYGIPEAIYSGTLEGLSERSLKKFHLRMAGDKQSFEQMEVKLPVNPDIEKLKQELSVIRETSLSAGVPFQMEFDRAYLATNDSIFPFANLRRFWSSKTNLSIIEIESGHAADIAAIIEDCLPDTPAIGRGFARAVSTYKENAVVQKEICRRMIELLRLYYPRFSETGQALLEIGVGGGLLTEEWSKYVVPERAVFIDLTDIPAFNIAGVESYLTTDAEKWLEESDESFDIILSASTIQWFVDPIKFLATVRSHLNRGGVAVISTFVKGNLFQLDSVRPCPIIYHTEEDYRLIEVEYSECLERTLHFDSAKEMMMHLRLTGVSPDKSGGKSLKKSGSPNQSHGLTGLPNELTYRPMILVVKN